MKYKCSGLLPYVIDILTDIVELLFYDFHFIFIISVLFNVYSITVYMNEY